VWRLFTYDVPAQPPSGPPVRSMSVVDREVPSEVAGAGGEVGARGGRDGGDGRRGGGPADIVDGDGGGGGGGWGTDSGPADAMEMIMASLRYKLELRDKAYEKLARTGAG
jgi:hypothetical protein